MNMTAPIALDLSRERDFWAVNHSVVSKRMECVVVPEEPGKGRSVSGG